MSFKDDFILPQQRVPLNQAMNGVVFIAYKLCQPSYRNTNIYLTPHFNPGDL